MKKPTPEPRRLSESERRLIKQLRDPPEMLERVQSILEITTNQDGSNRKADEVEELLVQEMRKLGHASLSQWALQAEEERSNELKGRDSTVRSRKKTLTWWSVFGLVVVSERIWCSQSESYLRLLPGRLGVVSSEEGDRRFARNSIWLHWWPAAITHDSTKSISTSLREGNPPKWPSPHSCVTSLYSSITT